MSCADGLGVFRVPTSPYPGLRPFLDHEASLFLGRGQQVKDIVQRLEETQFVAVIGGSGSGKSSLVRAGVVPKLRGFGIPEAGDYWVPVVFTPGTTATPESEASQRDEERTASQTPITRLAWKFSQTLNMYTLHNDPKTVDDVRESARRSDIAAIFRRGSGFARLIDAFSKDLPARGPKPENARFLVVIDQFEELFHPNNNPKTKGNEDTRTLIEAVIDHFFSPHPRCFVIITMRSEHLADCAGYLELPDAINESVYLVRRPDKEQLRQAITGPANKFLRTLQRGDDAAGLPEDIAFDETVVKRLLQDVEGIADDPDHLPLLQHLLARIWQVASKRCGVDGEHKVPNAVQWADLEGAADPACKEEVGWLIRLDADRKQENKETLNTLRASLENWAQATYGEKSEGDRKHLDFVLRRLAFKDPNNGTYNQQRLDVDDPDLFAGEPEPPTDLRALLKKGYLDSVHYLYWDRENPLQVTLKVSHESFIRGWAHFKGLVDEEAVRFEAFLSVLRCCSQWRDEKWSPERLLGQPELIRLDEARLGPVFAERDKRDDWFRTLKQYRDGDRLGDVEGEVANYIEASRAKLKSEADAQRALQERERKAQEDARLAEEQARNAREEARLASEREKEADRRREAEEKAHELSLKAEADAKQILEEQVRHSREEARLVRLRDSEEKQRIQAEADRSKAKAWGWGFLAVAAVIALFVAAPYLRTGGVMKASQDFAMARQTVEQRSYGLEPDSRLAGHELDKLLMATSQVADGQAKGEYINQPPTKWFSLFPQISLAQRLVYLQDTEPVVNGNLRSRMITGIWRSDRKPPENKEFDPDNPIACKGNSLSGIFYPARGTMRGIFLPERKPTDDINFYAATYARSATGQEATCTLSPTSIWREAFFFDPVVLLDANDRYMTISRSGQFVQRGSVNLYRIVWDDDPAVPSAKVDQIGQVIGEEAVNVLKTEIKSKQEGADPKVKSVRTWPEDGGVGVEVGGKSWRLFDDDARELEVSDGDEWKKLADASPDCKALEKRLRDKGILNPTFDVSTKSDGAHCFVLQIPKPPASKEPGSTLEAGNAAAHADQGGPPEKIAVGVYNALIPGDLQDVIPTAVTAIQQFSSRKAAEGATWMVGVSGKHAGWIALAKCDGTGKKCSYSGTPWSTSALARLGKAVVAASCDPLSDAPKAMPRTVDKYVLQCPPSQASGPKSSPGIASGANQGAAERRDD
ncbi:MAP7 domain-containing protein [Ferribacterium limneticum]|uniref:MAP7 domain-containing protein n=1 Tax=Ferribacterium limneticum TaxID=76259 RepID=UPI001CF7FC30|nr:MAP7 domain-containing protein [Ferribacterium limneticum]UCV21661.1 hypothetical protein KI613_14065 [Ferribacterium limneticum]